MSKREYSQNNDNNFRISLDSQKDYKQKRRQAKTAFNQNGDNIFLTTSDCQYDQNDDTPNWRQSERRQAKSTKIINGDDETKN